MMMMVACIRVKKRKTAWDPNTVLYKTCVFLRIYLFSIYVKPFYIIDCVCKLTHLFTAHIIFYTSLWPHPILSTRITSGILAKAILLHTACILLIYDVMYIVRKDAHHIRPARIYLGMLLLLFSFTTHGIQSVTFFSSSSFCK